MIDRKHLSQRIAFGTFRLLSLTVVGILFAILGFIIYKGIGVISWEFLTTAPKDGMTAGGIWPAIVGTFYLMIGSALFAFPVGVMSGIYMNEYAPKGWIVRFIRMMTNNLSGIPSIVFGLSVWPCSLTIWGLAIVSLPALLHWDCSACLW